jgi:hypothetical protein
MLPKIKQPTFSVIVPSTGKPVLLRMMSRAEEKILLIARTTEDVGDWLQAVRQVVHNCVQDAFDVGKAASFDLEYLFVKLRSASISPTQKLTYRDHEDEKDYAVDVNLEDIKVVFPGGDDLKNTIELGEGSILEMCWAPASTWTNADILKAEDPESAMDELVIACLEKIWIGNQAFNVKETPKAEILMFLNDLDVPSWDKIRNRISKTPHLSYWVSWTNSLGTERRFELRRLADYFSFGNPAQ